MKRFINASVILTFLVIFAGCVKDNGPSGNAVLDHYTYTVLPGDWTTRGDFGLAGFQYYTEIDIPGITPFVMESGAVMVYVKLNDLFYPLPAITNNDFFVTTIQNNVYQGMVEIFIEDTDFQTAAPGSYTFKIVVFDQISSLPKSLDIKDYKQVEAYITK